MKTSPNIARRFISRNPDPRVEPPVEEVRQRVGQDVGDADDEDAALDEPVVALVDALLDEEEAEPRPVEDLLGDDGAGEQHAELEAEDGDDRYQPVLQHVLVDD